MQPSSRPNLPSRYLQALQQVLAEIETLTEPVGILLTGSVIHGNASETSDLDVAILHDRSWRQRIQRVVDGTPVEVFINSEPWWVATFRQEASTGRMPSAHFIARGHIWHDSSGRMAELQHIAQEFVDRGPQVAQATLLAAKYAAVSTLEDGTDSIAIDADRAKILLLRAIELAVHYHYQANRIWIPREKDLFLDLDARWPELALNVRKAVNLEDVVALNIAATTIVEACTADTRFFDWSSYQQNLETS